MQEGLERAGCVATKDQPFEKMRQEALHLFQEPALTPTLRARETWTEDLHRPEVAAVETKGPIKELLESQGRLVARGCCIEARSSVAEDSGQRGGGVEGHCDRIDGEAICTTLRH